MPALKEQCTGHSGRHSYCESPFLFSAVLLSHFCVLLSARVCVDVICLCVAVKAGPLYLMAGASEITPLDSSCPVLIFTQCHANGSGGLSFLGALMWLLGKQLRPSSISIIMTLRLQCDHPQRKSLEWSQGL